MHDLPSPSAFAFIFFSWCPYFWQSLVSVCTLNSRQKNHWKIHHCLVCSFPLNQQVTVPLYYHIVIRVCGQDRQKSSGCISVLYCVILCCISSLRPFRIIWMELGNKECLQMAFFCHSCNKNSHLQNRNGFKRTQLFI